MRIIENLIVENDKTNLVSDIFVRCLKELNYQFFDRIELHLQKEDKIKLDFQVAYIFLDYNDPFIQSSDQRAIKIMIMKKLISLAVVYKYQEKGLPEFMLDIISGREVIKKGYDRDLFYYYYLLLIQHESHNINELSTYLKINIPWLSYYGLDDYDSKALKKLINMFEYRKEFEYKTEKLFLAVKKDLLKGKGLDDAIEAYNDIMKKT